MTRYVNPYGSEEELCAEFRAEAEKRGWAVYPEAHGDLFLVSGPNCTTRNALDRRCELPEGVQVVVEAKMRGNVQLLRQIADHTDRRMRQPALVIALVPKVDSDFRRVALRLGAVAIDGARKSWDRHETWVRHVDLRFLAVDVDRIPGNLAVPDLKLDVPAGVASPKRWTPWKEQAVRFCMEFDGKPVMTSSFRDIGMSMTIWRSKGWIRQVGKDGRRVVYELTEAEDRPDRAFPEIVEAIRRGEG